MILKRFRHLSAILALAFAPVAGANDTAVMGAYDAWRAGDALKLARHTKQLDGHPLTPWLEYWRLSIRLEDIPKDEVRAVLETHKGTYAADLLRGEWLKVLGRRADWQAFDAESASFRSDDLELKCYGLLSRLWRGDASAVAEAEAVWMEPTELPDGCGRLVAKMHALGHVSVTDVWRRVRHLFEHGQITAAKNVLGMLPKSEAPNEGALVDAARQPKRLIDRLPKSLERRSVREVAILAAVRYARTEPKAAARALETVFDERLPDKEMKYLWGQVAYEGARDHLPEALLWFERAADTPLDDRKLAWKARAGLRAGQWAPVKDAIDRMSYRLRHEVSWTYWYGRALAAEGEHTGSRAFYLRIAGQPNFYGLLASEELGYVVGLPDQAHAATEAQIEEAGRNPGLTRALTLIRLGIRTEGVREWLHTLRYFDDMKLLAAAEFALRAGIYDRSIQAADRTVSLHNFYLRYPVPFRDSFTEYAQTHGVDEAWVFGLVRQESRFIVDAKSSAGAAGLMQLMPATARLVAQRIGLRNLRQKGVIDVPTNITLGTGYLRMVMDQLGHPVLASAAYNAGPARARKWRDAKPMEGAVYAETIPFPETRDYVKKVMANAVFYAAIIERKTSPIKPRLGWVPARNGAEAPIEDETQ
jgi:soluble lytic murein transglycosylase